MPPPPLRSKDVDEIVNTVALLAGSFFRRREPRGYLRAALL